MKRNSLVKHVRVTVFSSVIALWLLTTGYTLTRSVQVSIDRYNTTEAQLRLIQVVISLPMLFIYLAIGFAVVGFVVYTNRIKGSKEHKGYSSLTKGLVLALGYFFVTAVFNVIRSRYQPGEDQSNFIIVRNYTGLLINLFIYGYFWQASKQLVSTLKEKSGLAKNIRWAQVLILAFTAIYAYLVFQNPNRTNASSDLIQPTFALPDILIVFTIILPYLLTWLMAAMAVVNFSFYAKNVSGIIFKQVFRDLARGFAFITGLAISLQIIGQFSEFWASTGLGSILLIIALIFFALVFAYLQFGLAARKLDKIETV